MQTFEHQAEADTLCVANLAPTVPIWHAESHQRRYNYMRMFGVQSMPSCELWFSIWSGGYFQVWIRYRFRFIFKRTKWYFSSQLNEYILLTFRPHAGPFVSTSILNELVCKVDTMRYNFSLLYVYIYICILILFIESWIAFKLIEILYSSISYKYDPNSVHHALIQQIWRDRLLLIYNAYW